MIRLPIPRRRRLRPKSGKLSRPRRLLRWALLAAAGYYAFIAACLIGLRWIDPPFTAVHIQRRIESWGQKSRCQKRYTFVPLHRISPHLQHAVIAAEDGNFYRHHGFDWGQIREVIEDDLETGRLRGASTITQQLVKNLFLSTHRSPIRKGIEITLTPLAELLVSKQRLLELYLNVIEWGPGVYGAEAAARHHYGIPAARVEREQGARLAAVLPSPRRRTPARMDQYSAIILGRMEKLGW